MSTKVYNILLVEDNAVDARVITEALTKTGEGAFAIQRAEQLSEALEKLRTQAIDLVLLDFMLPDSEGMATFTAVRKEAPNVPVVALTGVSDENIAIEAVRQGAQDFLVKGQVQPKALHRALYYAIERHKAQVAQLKHIQEGKTGKMIGVIGARGGVGTTTVALNVATALAKRTKTTMANAKESIKAGAVDLATGLQALDEATKNKLGGVAAKMNISLGSIFERGKNGLASIFAGIDIEPLLQGLRDRRSRITGRCRRCKFFDACGGSLRVRADARCGDPWAPDPACYLTDEEIGLADRVTV